MDDDFKFADFFEIPESDGDPTARGIVQCLRMLADEAVALGLGRTLAALRTAITVCAGEGDAADIDGDEAAADDAFMVSRPPGVRLH